MLHKILIDAAVPYIQGVFEPYFEQVIYVPGASIDRALAADADAMVIRTRTKCNAALLEGSKVQAIATATIGMDHIDAQWCAAHGIDAFNAPGCNADGVMEWVFAALKVFEQRGVGGFISRTGRDTRSDAAKVFENSGGGFISRTGEDSHANTDGAVVCDTCGSPSVQLTLGVIGVGQVGHRVADMGRRRGFRVLENDPPLAAKGTDRELVDLDTLLEQSDIVTVHIPLWPENRDFASDDFFEKMKSGAIFLNASRGGIVDEEALLKHRSKLSGLAVDVWKGEPAINPDLLSAADIATPHIAGYTKVGKVNGTVASVRGIARHFGISQLENFSIQHSYKPYDIDGYDILADDAALRSDPSQFESLRNHYNLRG